MVQAPPRASVAEQAIELWKKIPVNYYKETNLETNFVSPLLNTFLGIDFNLTPKDPLIGEGLKPDYLVYRDKSQPPVLVIEDKRRDNNQLDLTKLSDEEFERECKSSYKLYKEAVGYPEISGNNGIKQYLDITKVRLEYLAKYGLVFNGDFFQLWRRVDGLILPMTPIQRVNEETIPELIKQLRYCIFEDSQLALITGIWNRKGGVGKTTNTINLASTLALNNKKVLLIDFDTQCDLTRAFRLDPKDYKSYLGNFFDKIQAKKIDDAKNILVEAIQRVTYQTSEKIVEERKYKSFELDILPGNSDDLETLRTGIKTKSFVQDNLLQLRTGDKIRFIKYLVELLADRYDYIFIDNSPASDVITGAVLGACDTILIPCDYSRKSLHHAVDIDHKVLPGIRKFNSNTKNLSSQIDKLYAKPWSMGIIFSNCPGDLKPEPIPEKRSSLEKCIQNELKDYSGMQYETRLKIYAQTKLAEYKHKPVVCWHKSPITKLYRESASHFCRE